MFLVVVDAYLKWMEVKITRTATMSTKSTTVTALRSIFATHGIPKLIVLDNGSVFTSAAFKDLYSRKPSSTPPQYCITLQLKA